MLANASRHVLLRSKVLECYNYIEEVISLIRKCYVTIEFINSVTEELNGNRSVWWLMNDLQG